MKSSPMLSLKNVTRTFTQGSDTVQALRKTDFTARKGEFIAIIGPSGSGKSTLLTIAGGLQHPSQGSVVIDGTNITKLSLKQLSEVRLNKIGFILQTSSLVPFFTVEEQLLFIDRMLRRPSDKSAVTALLKKLGIEKRRTTYPNDLSGGERQRAAIAKVVYGDFDLILADEPTASLDTTKAFGVVKLLAEETHNRNKTTIMVTHDERLTEFCDTVYEMHDGVLTKLSKQKSARKKTP